MNEQIEATEGVRTSNSKMLKYLLVFTTCFLILLTVITNPTKGGPSLILVFLASVYLWLVLTSWAALEWITKTIGSKRLSNIRKFYTSVSLAFGLVFLIGLQTLRQLQLADIILTVVFELLLNFYLLRRF